MIQWFRIFWNQVSKIIHMNIKFVFHPNWINLLWFQKSCSSSLHFKSHLTNSLIMSVNEERKSLAKMIMNLEIKDHSFSSIKADWFQCWVLDSFWSTSKVPISNWNIKSKNAKRKLKETESDLVRAYNDKEVILKWDYENLKGQYKDSKEKLTKELEIITEEMKTLKFNFDYL